MQSVEPTSPAIEIQTPKPHQTRLLLKTGHQIVIEGMSHSEYKHRRRTKQPIVLKTKEGHIKIEFAAVDKILP
jgi:competence protein ComGF